MEYLSKAKANYHRSTKIVATLGPASSSKTVIKKLVDSGVNVFRLNFSHGTAEDHAARAKIIREIEQQTGKHLAILADLQGPKLRIGTFKNDKIELKKGQTFRFDSSKEPGDETRVHLPHPEVIEVLKAGHRIYLDDGKVRIEIVKKSKGVLLGKVIDGKELSNRKGFNLPDVALKDSSLTKKDREDLKTALKLKVDWVAQSFVQTADDVIETQKLIKGKAGLIAKIEKPIAIANYEAIVDIVDGIMLARGDLGVEIPPEDVPTVQKKAIQYAREQSKPIIVATQMLESMISAPAPTRAEASDVATAIYDGTDAVMLSAETASGKYPVEAVKMMARIAMRVEQDTQYRKTMRKQKPQIDPDHTASAITSAADTVSENMDAAAIVTFTTSGSTALRASRQRPYRPIICLTQSLETARRLCLSYGVRPIYMKEKMSFEAIVDHAAKVSHKLGFAKKNDRIVITAGVPFGRPGSTNTLRVARLK